MAKSVDYVKVVKDLQKRREDLSAQIRKIDNVVAQISSLTDEAVTTAVAPVTRTKRKYVRRKPLKPKTPTAAQLRWPDADMLKLVSRDQDISALPAHEIQKLIGNKRRTLALAESYHKKASLLDDFKKLKSVS